MKKKKGLNLIIKLAFVVMFILIIIIVVNEKEVQSTQYSEKSTITISEKTKVLKDSRIGNSSEVTFKIRNSGDFPIIITNIYTSCSCLSYEYNNDPILPKKKINFKIKIKHLNNGIYSKTFKIYGNFINSPIQIRITGKVI